MHSHQKLLVFLPRLHAELVRNGMSKDTAKFTCKAMRAGAGPPILKTLEDYRQGWILYHSLEDILTTMDEGSDAAAWCMELAVRIIGFEDAYLKLHGHRPLDPGRPEWTDRPHGNA